MPEGDTIFRAVRTLHRALAGRTVTRFESALPAVSRVDGDTHSHGPVQELGPDPLAGDFRAEDAAARIRTRRDLEIADALLD